MLRTPFSAGTAVRLCSQGPRQGGGHDPGHPGPHRVRLVRAVHQAAAHPQHHRRCRAGPLRLLGRQHLRRHAPRLPDARYEQLAIKKPFKRLRANVPVLSIWDDHDFGGNDDGAENPFKTTSEQIFLDFWRVPADSDRRKRPGIYGHHIFEENGRKLQLILLDTRYFRGKLTKNKRKDIKGPTRSFDAAISPTQSPLRPCSAKRSGRGSGATSRERGCDHHRQFDTVRARLQRPRILEQLPAEKARMLVDPGIRCQWCDIHDRRRPLG